MTILDLDEDEFMPTTAAMHRRADTPRSRRDITSWEKRANQSRFSRKRRGGSELRRSGRSQGN